MISRHQRPVLQAPDARPTRTGTFPPELIAASNVRLRMAAGAGLAVSLIRFGIAAFADVGDLFATGAEGDLKLGFFGGVGLVSAIVIGLTYLKLSSRHMQIVCQAFYLLTVLLLIATESASAWDDSPYKRGIPLPAGIILLFPVIVPVSPKRYLIASFSAVAIAPAILYAVPGLVGHPPPSTEIIIMYLPPLVVASLVAALTARVIYQLGRDLGRAQRAGSYQLVERLGRGGMGEVWRAKHGMLAREAAIKVIRTDRGNQAVVVKRFEHEARVVSSLRSQHTVELYDFGITDDGALYYAMELLDGMDLEELVTQYGPQPPERVVHFLLQACHSLVEAHEAGLVHRDIKPANLFVTRLGRDLDVIKVLDFGLATKPAEEAKKESRLTQEGAVVGTPAYMAPEQVMGDQTLDGRADIYNLGLIAWWLLAGRDAFQASTATQVMFAHVQSQPDPPSAHAPNPIPAELDRVILHCLAKKPQERPQTADELAAALSEISLEPWTRDNALDWWAAHPRDRDGKDLRPAAVADTGAQVMTTTKTVDDWKDATTR